MLRSHRSLDLFLVTAVTLVGCSAPPTGPTAQEPPDAADPAKLEMYEAEVKLQPPDETRVIVELEPNARSAAAIAADYGLILKEEIPPHFAVLKGVYNLGQLRNDPDIAEAAVNEPVQTHGADFSFGFYEGDWDESDGPNQEAFEKLNLDFLHLKTRGRGVRVMVGDTGVDPEHRFLTHRIELLDSSRYLLGSVEPPPDDPDLAPAYGHGSHVSGCVLQVAPASTVIPARILGHDGIGSLQDFTRALAAAMDPELVVDIVNLSMSTSEEVPLVNRMVTALRDRGVVVVAAAGNYEPGTAVAPPPSPLSVIPVVVGVAAVDNNDVLTRYSRSGPGVDMSAPGTGIQSCYPGGGYTTGSGTSFSTPLITGAIALIMEAGKMGALPAITLLRPDCLPMFPELATDEGRIHPTSTLVGLFPTELDVRMH